MRLGISLYTDSCAAIEMNDKAHILRNSINQTTTPCFVVDDNMKAIVGLGARYKGQNVFTSNIKPVNQMGYIGLLINELFSNIPNKEYPECVITVPYGKSYDFKIAQNIAHFKLLQTIDEPTACLLGVEHLHKLDLQKKYIAMIQMTDDRFMISIAYRGQTFRILHHDEAKFGRNELYNNIMQYVLSHKQYQETLSELQYDEDIWLARLHTEIANLTQQWTDGDASLHLDNIGVKNGEAVDLNITIPDYVFEHALFKCIDNQIKPFINDIIITNKQEERITSFADIDFVVFSGLGHHLMVQYIHSFFQQADLLKHPSPHIIATVGAAVYANKLKVLTHSPNKYDIKIIMDNEVKTLFNHLDVFTGHSSTSFSFAGIQHGNGQHLRLFEVVQQQMTTSIDSGLSLIHI